MNFDTLFVMALILLLMVVIIGIFGMVIVYIIREIQQYKINKLEYEEKKRIMKKRYGS